MILSKLLVLRVGLTVRIRVVSVDAENERMLVAVAHSAAGENGTIRAQVCLKF